jgi:hypothetical protein
VYRTFGALTDTDMASMAPPEFALEDAILTYGPLPVGYHAMIVGNDVKYTQNGIETFPEHVLGEHFRLEMGKKIQAGDTSRPFSVGVTSPPQHNIQDFQWIHKPGGIENAVIQSLISRDPSLSATEITTRVHQLEASSYPLSRDMYDPRDRHSSNALGSKDEKKAARLVRSFGYSLVIIDSGVSSVQQFLFPGEDRPSPIVRWSFGEQAELFPPLYVGVCIKQYFGLDLKAPLLNDAWDEAR